MFKKNKYLLLIWVIYFIFIFFLFNDRILHVFDLYSMSGVDTDWVIWYLWANVYSSLHNIPLLSSNQFISYPRWYDISYIPWSNLVYRPLLVINSIFLPTDPRIFIAQINISLFLSYVLTGIGSFLLINHFTKDKAGSFLWSLCVTFSYYVVLMWRWSLSINHFYILIFFLLFFVRYFSKFRTRDLIISYILWILCFSINAYWYFFGLIIAILLWGLYFEWFSSRDNIIKFIKYFFLLWIFTILWNSNFLISQLFVFDKDIIVQAGKDFSLSYLPNIRSFFMPTKHALWLSGYIWDWFFLGYVALLIATLGLFTQRNLKLYSKFLLIMLICVTLWSVWHGFEFINQAYMKYFYMFRNASRLVIIASLFLWVLVSFAWKTISQYFKFNIFIYYIILLLLASGILIEWLNTDPTRQETTNYSKIIELYQPLKNDKTIKIIAQYPMWLSNGIDGFPPNYKLIAQTAHEKIIIGGIDPFNSMSRDTYKNFENINSPQSIPYLRSIWVDSIIIHDRLVDMDIVTNLKLNNNLNYVWTFEISADEWWYISYEEQARRFSLFKIINPRIFPKSNFIFWTENIKLQKNNAYNINLNLTIQANSTGGELSYLQSFNTEWKLYPWQQIQTWDCTSTVYYSGWQDILEEITLNNNQSSSWSVYKWVVISGWVMYYIVQRYETLLSIITRYGYDYDQIRILNPYVSMTPKAGALLALKLPKSATTPTRSRDDDGDDRVVTTTGSRRDDIAQLSSWQVLSGDKKSELMSRWPTTECVKSPSPDGRGSGWGSYTFMQWEELSYLWRQPLRDDTHEMVYDYANGWKIDLSVITPTEGKIETYMDQWLREWWITPNPDWSYNVSLTLYFRPQSWFYLWLIISGTTLFWLIGWLLWDWRRKRKHPPHLQS